jgi:syntaxin-binding protein 1
MYAFMFLFIQRSALHKLLYEEPSHLTSYFRIILALSDDLMQRISSSGAGKYIKNLKELFLDFLAVEQRVFSLDSPSSFFRLYSPDAGGLPTQSKELDQIAKRVASFMATMGDSPFLRYYKPADAENNHSAKLAHMVAAELEHMSKLDPEFPVCIVTLSMTLLLYFD